MKKKIWLCLIAQIICWSIMTLVDYIDETCNGGSNLVIVFVFAIPAVCVVLYIIFRRWIYDHRKASLKDIAIICGTWLICGLVLGVIITGLVSNEMWIVPQFTGDWAHLLNGLEYIMHAVTLAGIPLLAVVLIETAIGIANMVRKK